MQTDETTKSDIIRALSAVRKHADKLSRKLRALVRLIYWGTLYLVELIGNALVQASCGVRTHARELSEPYRLVMLAVLGAAVGIAGLRITALSYPEAAGLFAFYFSDARILVLNVLPAILLTLLGYFVFLRAWAGVLVSAVPTLLLAIGNYFKLRLRDEPVVFSDISLLRTVGGIVGKYDIAPTMEMVMAFALIFCLCCLGILFIPHRGMKRQMRLLGAELCLLCVSLLLVASFSDEIYTSSTVPEGINTKFYAQDYVAHGSFYPFLHSAKPTNRSTLTGAMTPQETYESYQDADIPAEQKVQVMGIMCEAFADFSGVPAFAENETIQNIYAPLHELEERAISGNLLTNIFGGGTVDSEWCVLTGYSAYGAFKKDTESYVRYFADQGFDTIYQHPGHEWFYERKDVNRYLGFSHCDFSENCFAEQVDVDTAMFHSDDILIDHLLEQVGGRTQDDAPLFSFSVTIQNHGPYNSEIAAEPNYLGYEPDWSRTTYNILSNYFYGINETIGQMVRLTDGLEESEDPVVLFVFGDHKPWLGDNKSSYLELGIDMDFTETDGFYNTFATPYFIWANSAAKEVLGNEFVGDGGDFSPCFLMTKVFDECGWEGPGFMQFGREMRAVTPVLSQRGLFMKDGEVCAELSEEDAAVFQNYLSVQYWRKENALASKL